MSAAAIAISTGAAAQAAAAAAQAHQARVTACQALVRGYAHETATVEQAQQYAGCISTLYPQPPTPADVGVLKLVFVLALAGMCFGASRGLKTSWGDWTDAVMFGLLGFFVLPLAVGAVFGIGAGIYWLFT